MSNQLVYKISSNGIVAAIYFILTIISTPFAYGDYQIRIAEIMILLCFFRRDLWVGVTLGCLFSNLASPLGYWDWIIGTGATLISSLLVAYASPRLLVGCFYPIVINGFLVALELNQVYGLPYFYCVGTVAAGEAIAIFLGYALLMIFKKRPSFFRAFHADRHLDFRF